VRGGEGEVMIVATNGDDAFEATVELVDVLEDGFHALVGWLVWTSICLHGGDSCGLCGWRDVYG